MDSSIRPIVLLGKRRGFSPSMHRYFRLLLNGLLAKGHPVVGETPPDYISRFLPAGKLRYWAEYAEQYFLFPLLLKRRIRRLERKWAGLPPPIIHICDHSDAQWIRGLGGRTCSITVHDCIARRVQLGEFPGQHKGFLGRLQQDAIYRALNRFTTLVAISEATRMDLLRLLEPNGRRRVEVVPNGPAHVFHRLERGEADACLKALSAYRRWADAGRPPLLLIVGGDVFYKNRTGALQLAAGLDPVQGQLPWCLVIGNQPADLSGFPEERLILRSGISDEELEAWYSLAAVLLFPSLAEGFGWPLLEAQQNGCLVVTTDIAPMNEIVSEGALLLPPMPDPLQQRKEWLEQGSCAIHALLSESVEAHSARREQGYAMAACFSQDKMIEGYLDFWNRL